MTTVLAGIQLLPNQKEDHTGGTIKQVLEMIESAGVRYEVGALETVVEGDYETILSLIKDIHEKVVDLGVNEYSTNIKIHYRSEGVSFEDKF
ncbi:MTH1187 family thiamine-binding protein [Alkalihalobacillus trypoxylicola]|uniref:Thiamine-binding protein domain-containing protein n=1 Tax=Alkalihalobacillus trypoxylicola TaxID=519424 RepID=A0A162DF68_9BACI|nr:thiamine-binding protein [Alkalihalobacillus trypoxylicola]KYG29440.1 hypothetical protein AZF04_07920 [Alkalihalobacillus trypoxylicola]GAF63349.1 hypothetical protein BTS2_0240 [Bacillus sp. TS-2]